MLTYANSNPQTVNPTTGPMNGTGRHQDPLNISPSFGASYGQTTPQSMFGSPYVQQPTFGYQPTQTPYAQVPNYSQIPQPFYGACPTPFGQLPIPFGGIPTMTPSVMPMPIVSPFGFNPYQTIGSFPVAYNGFAGIPNMMTPFVHPMATINPTTPFVNPMLNNVVNPFVNATPFGTVNPFIGQPSIPSISPFANNIGLNNGQFSPFGVSPNQTFGNTPFATPFGSINTPFGIQNVPGITPWNVNPSTYGLNHTLSNTTPFGATPSIGGFNPTVPFGGVSPIANNFATQSQLPWQWLNAMQSPIYGGNVSTPWLGGFNSLNPLSTLLPTWLNSIVNQGVGSSSFGTGVNSWGLPNFGSPITTPFGGYPNQNMNAYCGISPWQSMGGSFGQPIGFGSSNCVTPFGCCL